MVKFVCKNCKYKFKRELDEEVEKCPVCNKENLEKEQDAEEIIKEVGEILKQNGRR